MKRLLIVEPDARLRDLYEVSITQAGFEVVTSADAQSAIHACETQQPACIVLELQLKTHGGIEFLYELRSYPDWQTIPVIIYSFVPPHELAPFKESLEALGVVEVCYKPQTTIKKLITVIQDIALVS